MYKIAKKEYSWCYIELPKYVAKKLLEFGKEIGEGDLYKKEAENGLEKSPHITLKYALLTNNSKDIKDVLKKEKGGKVHVSKSSIFETDEYDVVKMSIESDDLQRLHSKINNLPHEDSYPEYIPHATIAYVKKGCGKKYDGKFIINKSFRFNEVFFGDKTDKEYRIILSSIKESINNIFLRLSWFSKKIFIHSSLRGEWWIIDNGQAEFADGDSGDIDHDSYTVQYVQRKYMDDDRFDHDEWIDWDGFEKSIMEKHKEEIEESKNKTVGDWLINNYNMEVEELEIARGKGDPKGYAVKNYGWKKVNGNNISTWTLDSRDMANIAKGLWEASGEDPDIESETFNIYVESNNKAFYDVPLSVIERNTPSDLMEYMGRY
jgi:2'-5' RNA ligase